MLLSVQRVLDRAQTSDYLSRCAAVFDRNRQVMSATAFERMTTCASKATTVEAFAECANADELSPVEASQPVSTSEVIADPTSPEGRAKALYLRAERLVAAGRWAEAVPVYEEAYYLVPGRHGLAHKIGVAAWNSRDCDTAKEYLEHFLRYADAVKFRDKLEEAKQILEEIAVWGCATI